MSYILDALKRADHERERGAVPGLYARQVISPSRPNGNTIGAQLWAGLALTLLVLGLVAAGLYLLRPSPEPAQLAALRLGANQMAPVVGPVKPPAPTAVEPASETITPSSQDKHQPGLFHPASPHGFKPVVMPAAPQVTPAVVPAPRNGASAPNPSPPPVSAAQMLPGTPLLSELPEELRRQIPALTVTGVVFSDAPGQRLLLVNNQVMTQGSPITAELTLIEVGAKSSIFSFRNTRFRLPH